MFILALGFLAIPFIFFSYLHEASTKQPTRGQHPMLRAGNSMDSGMTNEVNTTLHWLSAMVWGLVIAKAKQGLSAADSKDSSEV